MAASMRLRVAAVSRFGIARNCAAIKPPRAAGQLTSVKSRLWSLEQRKPLCSISHSRVHVHREKQAGIDTYRAFRAFRAFSNMSSTGVTAVPLRSNGHVLGHESTAAGHSSGMHTASSVPPYKNVETVALVVEKPKEPFKLEPIVLDEVRENELLIDMKFSGICHTDLVMQQGLLPMVEYPAIFGHEGAGYILEIGSGVKNKDLKVGDAVLLSFNTCGICKPCKAQHPAYCHQHPQVNHNAVRLSDRSTPASLKSDGRSVRSQYFGQSSFAKKSVVNEKCVVKCPYPDKLEIYAPIGCGFQTGAGTVLNVLKPGPEDSLVLFGLGSVGIACLMAAKYAGCGKIIAVDIVNEKLDMAKELGATDCVNSREKHNVVEEIRKITGGMGATMAVDCTGILKVIEDMVESIGPEGVAVLVGVPPQGAKVEIDPLMFLLDNKQLMGVIEGDSNPEEFIPQLMEMHQKGHFPIEHLCRTYPVEKLEEAIHDMHTGKVIKPVISWG